MKYLIIPLLLLLSACKIRTLVPLAPPEKNPNPKPHNVIINFEHLSWQGHIQEFALEIINYSPNTLTFSPDSVYYQVVDAEVQAPKKHFGYNYLAARQAIKRNIKKSKANKTVLDVATLYQLGPDATNSEVNNQYLALDQLPGDYLMPSSIAPGETVSGLIFFPTSKAKHFHFFIPLASAVHEFWFHAKKKRRSSIRITVDK